MGALDALRSELAEFDGKAVSILSEIAAHNSSRASFFDDLIELIPDEEGAISDGATWLIKAHFDDGGALSKSQTDRLVAAAPKTESWQAQLHLCQTIGRCALTPAHAKKLSEWLGPLLSHKRPFLRAWSLDALSALAATDPSLSDRYKTAMAAALNDSAASVRARARNIERSAQSEA